jgi:quercetin dioxygenase-like cupin family protein
MVNESEAHVDSVSNGYSLENHVEGTSRRLAAPLLRLELDNELSELRRSEVWRDKGHAAKTLVKYPDLRVVLVALKQGAQMGEHQAPRTTLQTISGHVRIKLDDQVIDLPAGGLLALEEQVPREVEALTESAVLITLAF